MMTQYAKSICMRSTFSTQCTCITLKQFFLCCVFFFLQQNEFRNKIKCSVLLSLRVWWKYEMRTVFMLQSSATSLAEVRRWQKKWKKCTTMNRFESDVYEFSIISNVSFAKFDSSWHELKPLSNKVNISL